jgi:hypothetical protein
MMRAMKRMSWLLWAALILGIACSGDSKDETATATSDANPTAGATARPTTAAAKPTPVGTALGDLALVYLDRSKGQDTEVYTAASDGSAPKKVGTLTGPVKTLDLRGKMFAYSGDNQLYFYDLAGGTSKNLTSPGTVSDGLFLDNNVFIYTTNAGCGPQRSVVMRVDLTSMEQKELVGLRGNLAIAAIDAASSTVAVVPRGCDPGVQTINLYGTTDGREIARLNTPGCGGVSMSLGKKQALVSWTFCTPATATSSQATLYDYSGATLTKTDIVGPSGGINFSPVLLRPNSNEAVFATKTPGANTSPGSVASSGVWQIDLTNLSTSVLVPGEGPEQAAVAWSPDGRYLIVQNTQAQGLCTYVIADATNKQVKPINKDITFCGANGEVIGWTSLK